MLGYHVKQVFFKTLSFFFQPKDTTPVMAITPNQRRPYPSSSVGSGGGFHGGVTAPPLPITSGHLSMTPQQLIAGLCVASSLPTALLKPNVIAANMPANMCNSLAGAGGNGTVNTAGGGGGGAGHPHTLWALRERSVYTQSLCQCKKFNRIDYANREFFFFLIYLSVSLSVCWL